MVCHLKTKIIAQYWLIPGMDLNVISRSNLNKLRAVWWIDLNVKQVPSLTKICRKWLKYHFANQVHRNPRTV